MWYELEGGCDLYRDWTLEIKNLSFVCDIWPLNLGTTDFLYGKKKKNESTIRECFACKYYGTTIPTVK